MDGMQPALHQDLTETRPIQPLEFLTFSSSEAVTCLELSKLGGQRSRAVARRKLGAHGGGGGG